MATATVDFELISAGSMLFDRTSIADKIEKYWAGKPQCRIGIQHLRLIDGKIVVKNTYERTDIGLINYEHGGVFIEADGKFEIQGLETDDQKEQDIIIKDVEKFLLANSAFVERHVKWFAEEPWKLLDGLTPNEAVYALKQRGW